MDPASSTAQTCRRLKAVQPLVAWRGLQTPIVCPSSLEFRSSHQLEMGYVNVRQKFKVHALMKNTSL